MRILINDFFNTKEDYKQIFKNFEYEEDSLIFIHSFADSKDFIVSQLENRKRHIDLIITSESSSGYRPNYLKANELVFFKNLLNTSYSNRNFRIASIPMILYQDNQGSKSDAYGSYNAIVEKNLSGDHSFMINTIETHVKNWRSKVLDDLDSLGIQQVLPLNFYESKYYSDYYSKKITPRAEWFFVARTSNLSLEFIKCPSFLNYDWLTQTSLIIEQKLSDYSRGYKHHIKYDRKNNENTILHKLLKVNSVVMLRDIFSSYLHEKPLEQNSTESHRCDFILKTQFPEYLHTTFLEVKKENIQLLVDKKSKRPLLSSDLNTHLGQLWDYRKFALDPKNKNTLTKNLNYKTVKFDYILLAGRGEEKDKFLDVLNTRLKDHYPGLKVYSYEDLERLAENYLKRFDRLSIN